MRKAEEKYEESVGVVLIYRSPSSSSSSNISNTKINNEQFLVLKSSRGDWNFVKGHREKEETDYETLKREIFEETGITSYNIIDYLGKIKYRFMKNGSQIKKEVKFYYAMAYTTHILLSNEHIDYRWLQYEEAKQLLTFDESKFILKKSFKKSN
jgi:8-oxo-dGTP pyrophosphatase MutT (NUDIX family)